MLLNVPRKYTGNKDKEKLTSNFPNTELILLSYGQLRERARWAKSCTEIGYPSRQYGAIMPARDYLMCPATNNSQKAK